jgi:hypothetical protein
MKAFTFSSLRSRLIILLLSVIIPSLGVFLYNASEQRQFDKIHVRNDFFQIAMIESSHEKELFDGTRRVLSTIAAFLKTHEGELEKCRRFFTDILRSGLRYYNIGAVRPNGDILCSAIPLVSSINFGNSKWLRQVVKTRDFTFGDYGVSRVTGVPILLMALPVIDAEDNVRAAVFAELELRWLNQFELNVKRDLPDGSTHLIGQCSG